MASGRNGAAVTFFFLFFDQCGAAAAKVVYNDLSGISLSGIVPYAWDAYPPIPHALPPSAHCRGPPDPVDSRLLQTKSPREKQAGNEMEKHNENNC